MRKIAIVGTSDSHVKRVMVLEKGYGVYLFSYDSLEDTSAMGDAWFESIEQVDEACLKEFNIASDDWKYINDTPEGCQDDWILPVRVKGLNLGQPKWGHLERFENGVWNDISNTKILGLTYPRDLAPQK